MELEGSLGFRGTDLETMIGEVELDLQVVGVGRHPARREPSDRRPEGHVPPVVAHRRERQPGLADDLCPQVQRVLRRLPLLEGAAAGSRSGSSIVFSISCGDRTVARPAPGGRRAEAPTPESATARGCARRPPLGSRRRRCRLENRKALFDDFHGAHDASLRRARSVVADDGAWLHDDGQGADATAVDHGAEGPDDHTIVDEQLVVREQMQHHACRGSGRRSQSRRAVTSRR